MMMVIDQLEVRVFCLVLKHNSAGNFNLIINFIDSALILTTVNLLELHTLS